MTIKTILLSLILTIISQTTSASLNYEWQIYRLLSPTFSELQSEAVDGEITTYLCIPDEIISQALNDQFERIEYMTFNSNAEVCK